MLRSATSFVRLITSLFQESQAVVARGISRLRAAARSCALIIVCLSLSEVSWELSFRDVIMSSSVCDWTLHFASLCSRFGESSRNVLLFNFSFMQDSSITYDVGLQLRVHLAFSEQCCFLSPAVRSGERVKLLVLRIQSSKKPLPFLHSFHSSFKPILNTSTFSRHQNCATLGRFLHSVVDAISCLSSLSYK